MQSDDDTKIYQVVAKELSINRRDEDLVAKAVLDAELEVEALFFKLLAACLILASSAAIAGVDQSWNDFEGGSGNGYIGGLVAVAAIAFVINLIDKGQVSGFIQSLRFLASIYLMGFGLIACQIVVFLLLVSLGMDRGAWWGWISFPLGFVAAYKLYSAYENWRGGKGTTVAVPPTSKEGSQQAVVGVSRVAANAAEAPRAASQSHAVFLPSPQSTTPSWRTSPPQQQSAGGPIKWGWVIVFLVLLGFLIAIFGSSNPSPKGIQIAPPTPSKHPSPPSTVPADTLTPLNEELPPVGKNKILRREQILHCLSQEIRLSGMRGVLNAESRIELAKFDAAIADYNSRCGYFRYYARVMQAARAEVEPHGEALRAEGSQTVYKWRQ